MYSFNELLNKYCTKDKIIFIGKVAYAILSIIKIIIEIFEKIN